MLRFLQNLSGSFLIKFLLILIGLSFIGWEFGNGLNLSSPNTLLTVNSQTLSTQAFSQELENRLNELRARMGQAYDPALIAQLNLVEIMLEEKTNALLLSDFAKNTGLDVANTAIAEEIKKAPAFQDELGMFNTAQYQFALQNAGYSVAAFETAIRDDIRRNYARIPFASLQFTNEEEAMRLAAAATQSRNVRILRFTRQDVPTPATPTEGDLKTIYDQMHNQLITPEERTFNAVRISVEDMAQTLSVSETEVKTYYNENIQSFSTPETRKVRHILLQSEQDVDAVLNALNNGANFASTAKKFSKDTLSAENGGSLGSITREDVVPGFANTAFSLKVGEISPPTKTAFGTHIIQVEEITPVKAKPLSALSTEIKATLLKEKAQNAAYDLIDHLDEDLSTGASLMEAAEALGLKTLTYTLNANGAPVDGAIAEDILNVMDRIFTMDQNVPSAPLELDKGHHAFIEVTNITPAAEKPFEAVQKELTDAYFNETYERAILAKATQALTKRLKGSSFEAIVKDYGLNTPIETVVGISRNAPLKTPLISASVKEKLLALPEGKAVAEATPTRLGAALYEVTTVEQPTLKPEDLQQAHQKLIDTQRNTLFSAFMQNLRMHANIDVNQAQITALKARLLPQAE